MTLRPINPQKNEGPPGPAADPVDAFFDQRAEGDAAARLAAALRSDVRTADDFARTQRLVSMFKEPLEGPDLSDAILRRLEERRGFGARLRRPRIDGRLAACIGLALGATALWLVEHNTQPAPARPAAPVALASGSTRGVLPLPGPIPASAPVRPARAAMGLSMGPISAHQLTHSDGSPLLLPDGSGTSTRLPGLREERLAWDAGRIEWGARRDSLLAIPALEPDAGGQSSLIKIPGKPEPGAPRR